MILVAGVVKTLVLLVPGVTCLAWPQTVQRMALEVSRNWGLGNQWQDSLLASEFLWAIRLCGLMLVVMAALLAFTLAS